MLDSLTPEIRRRCLHYLSRSCARNSLLPKSLLNPSGCSSKAITHKRSGFINVQRGRYNGQDVAAKTLNDLRRSRGVRTAQPDVFFTELIISRAEILRVGRNMEYLPPPKCAAIVGSHDDQAPVHDCVELDGEWEYQQIFEGPPRCQSTGTCAFTGYPLSSLGNGVE